MFNFCLWLLCNRLFDFYDKRKKRLVRDGQAFYIVYTYNDCFAHEFSRKLLHHQVFDYMFFHEGQYKKEFQINKPVLRKNLKTPQLMRF